MFLVHNFEGSQKCGILLEALVVVGDVTPKPVSLYVSSMRPEMNFAEIIARGLKIFGSRYPFFGIFGYPFLVGKHKFR